MLYYIVDIPCWGFDLQNCYAPAPCENNLKYLQNQYYLQHIFEKAWNHQEKLKEKHIILAFFSVGFSPGPCSHGCPISQLRHLAERWDSSAGHLGPGRCRGSAGGLLRRVGGGGFGLEKGRWKSRKPFKSILDIVSNDSECTLMPVSVVSCRLLAL